MSTLTRYVLLQAPSWAAASLAVAGLRHWLGLSLWIGAGLLAVWVLKDFALYPFLRRAYEGGARTGAEELIGARGVARDELSPKGHVWVRGELWRAEVAAGRGPISPGTPVRVQAARGLTLTVTGDAQGRRDAP